MNAWLVLPSGDLSGGTDAQNLACAFASAAVGDTVQLAAGSFYVNRTLDVVDFSGTVTGTKDALGNNMTILRDANAPGVVFEGFPVRGNVWDVLMVFRLENWDLHQRVYLTIQDLVVESSGVRAIDGVHVGGLFRVIESSPPSPDLLDLPVVHLDLTVRHVASRGLRGHSVWSETNFGERESYEAFYFTPLQGRFIYDGGTFENCGWGWDTWSFVDSEIVFRNIVATGTPVIAEVGDADNSTITITGFDVEGLGPAAAVLNGTQATGALRGSLPDWLEVPQSMPRPSVVKIEGSQLRSGGSSTVSLTDYGNYYSGTRTFEEVLVRGNTFLTLPNTRSFAPLRATAVAAVRGARFEDNWIEGSYWYGVRPSNGSNGWVIRENTFINTEARHLGIVFIWNSDHCEVTKNSFTSILSPAVTVWGDRNRVENNDYRQSGLPGWNVGTGAVFILGDSRDNLIVEGSSPAGVSFPEGTSVCDQVLDASAVAGKSANNVAGDAVCSVNPNWQSIVTKLETRLNNAGPKK